MATTTYSKITDIVEYLKARGGRMDTLIREIDGITCAAYLDTVDYSRGGIGVPTEDFKKVRLTIEAHFQCRHLYHKCFEKEATHEEIVAFLRTVPDLKYCKTAGQLSHDPAESKMYFERKFMEEVFNSVDEVVNYKTDYGECPVCLDVCYMMLGCGHHLCLQCESKMKDTKCPQCRDKYTRCPDDGDY